MAPDPRRERYEPSSRPCSTSWKFGPSPRKTVIASPSSRRTSSSPISTVPESSRYRAGLTMKVNLRPWNFRMTPFLVSVSPAPALATRTAGPRSPTPPCLARRVRSIPPPEGPGWPRWRHSTSVFLPPFCRPRRRRPSYSRYLCSLREIFTPFLTGPKVPDEGPSCSPAARAGDRDLQYIPFVEGLPLPQSLGTQHGEATSYSVRYPRYDQRPARGAR